MSQQPSTPPRRPNLLFVFPDQLGAVWTSVYGHPLVRTPNLDALAQQSAVFDRAFTASPVCTPYRGTLFTGRYPCQTGVLHNGYRLPPGETTLAGLFNAGGYATSYVGKWHLSGEPGGNRWVPPQERGGFADFIGWESHHARHWDQKLYEDDPDSPILMPGHETDGLTDIACRRLSRLAGQQRPFCLFVAYQAPHPICEPPEDYHTLYRGNVAGHRATVAPETRFGGYGGAKVDQGPQEFAERYFAEITHLDAAVGRLLETLDRAGQADNTIVVFTSDHGEMAGCHGRFGKEVMYEESIRVPLLVRGPGLAARRLDRLFSSVDFLPTLLDLCGLGPAPSAEGVSHAAALRGDGGQAGPREIFIELPDRACIRTERWKYEADASIRQGRLLIDLLNDPLEQTNLVGSPLAAEVQAHLHGRLQAWRDGMLSRRGDVEEARRRSPAFGG